MRLSQRVAAPCYLSLFCAHRGVTHVTDVAIRACSPLSVFFSFFFFSLARRIVRFFVHTFTFSVASRLFFGLVSLALSDTGVRIVFLYGCGNGVAVRGRGRGRMLGP